MVKPEITRREFLQVSAAVGTAAWMGVEAQAAQRNDAAAAIGATIPEWASKPRRWMQLTLVEYDPAGGIAEGAGTQRYDPAFWLDYFKRTRADGVCLSAGGCVAFYPTQVPFHHRSTFLGKRDVLGELVTGCRRLGMSVLLRTDPHATYDDAARAHPDWIMVTADGKPRRHWADPAMWVTCGYGPYNFEFMTAVHREIMQRYKPDGIFLNRWSGSGDCCCVHCRENFKTASGYELPRAGNADESVRRAYFEWKQRRLLDVLDVWNAEVRRVNPEASMIPNNGSGALNSLPALETSRRAPLLVADRQARHGLALPWLLGKTAKEYRATMGSKPVIGLFGVGLEEPYRWKDSVTSNAEIRIWVLEALANGMRPWCSKFSGTLHDERWLKGVEDLYVWAAEHEPYLVQQQPLARVGLVYSQQTAWMFSGWGFGTGEQAKVEDPAMGWYQALVEARIPFELVHDGLLSEADLGRYKVLLLPNLAALSDAQCAQLRAFVARGGSVVATSGTSLYDEHGTARANFGLADLFGVDWTGKREDRMMNSYIRLEHAALPRHPMFTGLEDAPRVINGAARLDVRPRERFAETPLTLIPSYPDLPMEKVYPRVARTDVSCLYLREKVMQGAGAPGGRVAYFPLTWTVRSGRC